MIPFFAAWQNHRLANDRDGDATWFTMRALPKAPGDNSVDFMPVWDTVNTNGNVSTGIFMFFVEGPILVPAVLHSIARRLSLTNLTSKMSGRFILVMQAT